MDPLTIYPTTHLQNQSNTEQDEILGHFLKIDKI